MSKYSQHLIAKTEGMAAEPNIIVVNNTRITVILPGVIRVEYGRSRDCFTDKATQKIWFRNMGEVEYSHDINGNRIVIKTNQAEVCINTVSGKLIYSKVGNLTSKGNNKKNLKGTARTLDQCPGAIPLDNGVLSMDGTAILDDSKSLLMMDDGQVLPRTEAERDYYVFAYGEDYISAVQALYSISGKVPFVPRYALGNWWSRYKAYTQDEYESLMLRFEEEEIPLTVATIDMDWHWVNLDEVLKGKRVDLGKKWGFGLKGWTGYSWNSNLFPDYKGFLKFLKDKNLKITMNLHPSSGVRCYENQYKEMAESLGVDPSTQRAIDFDCTSPEFMEAYLKYLHHPYEEDGVDFWWIDWQQGRKSAVPGLDPLWALNHYHYLDIQRKNIRPLILSRYAGIGSHRYPLGFSGDTWIKWSALRFQPYFTVNAANCGYTWWSHDIGGHIFGAHDDELYTRWVQFGVFSPINRLHSTKHSLTGKEPWNYTWDARQVTTEFLRLRHKLLPYIYTMNYRSYVYGRAICEPLYYTYKERDAYMYRNEYMFGDQLLVCPVTSKINKHTKKACTKMYLPKGRWTNLFTGEIYEGGKSIFVHSYLNTMPVFAKEGAIIPMSLDKGNGSANPIQLEWHVYRGNNSFSLYEDDGETLNYQQQDHSVTQAVQNVVNNQLVLEIKGGKKASYMPEKRKHCFVFGDIRDAASIKVTCEDKILSYAKEIKNGCLCIDLPELDVDCPIVLELTDFRIRKNMDYVSAVQNVMSRYNANNTVKSILFSIFKHTKSRQEMARKVKRVPVRALRKELLEVLEDLQ